MDSRSKINGQIPLLYGADSEIKMQIQINLHLHFHEPNNMERGIERFILVIKYIFMIILTEY